MDKDSWGKRTLENNESYGTKSALISKAEALKATKISALSIAWKGFYTTLIICMTIGGLISMNSCTCFGVQVKILWQMTTYKRDWRRLRVILDSRLWLKKRLLTKLTTAKCVTKIVETTRNLQSKEQSSGVLSYLTLTCLLKVITIISV